jgi:hypothetical protein
MGKPSEWSDLLDVLISDTNPPLPDPSTVFADLTEQTVLKKATLQLVVPDNTVTGTIQAYAQKWRPVTPVEAMDLGARWVYVNASFDYNEAPISDIDTYLTANAILGATVLNVQNAAGYQVGDDLILGLAGQQTQVDSVNLGANTITITDPLTALLYAGTYITNTTFVPAYTYRQISVLSHVTVGLGAPGQLVAPAANINAALLEYYYNTQPIPRQVNRRDDVKLILTF